MTLAFITLAVGFGFWLFLFPTPRFPVPTGPYGIGTRLFYWTDPTRPEPFTAEIDDLRKLIVQVWYPSLDIGPVQPYIDHAEVAAPIALQLHVPAFLLANLENAPTHAVLDGSPEQGPYPVLLNPTGFLGFRAVSLFWIEEIVSHGYVVVTLDQPGTAAGSVWSDGSSVPLMADKAEFDRYMPLALSLASDKEPQMNGVALPEGVIPFLAQDLSFVLDQLLLVNKTDPALMGTLDMEHVGAFGLSLGGYAAPEACHRDSRFKACLTVDAGKSETVTRDGLDQPLMLISRDAAIMREERRKAGGWPEPEIEHTIAGQRGPFEHNRGDAYFVTMNGMHHVNWTDAPIWSPLVRWIGLAGPIDPYRGFALTNSCTLSFFDRYLKGARASPICGEAGKHPDIRLESRMAGSD